VSESDLVAGAPKALRPTIWILSLIVVTAGVVVAALGVVGSAAKNAAALAVEPLEVRQTAHEKDDEKGWKAISTKLDEIEGNLKDTHDQVVELNQWRKDQQDDDHYAWRHR
jgi:flagellar basal body-associated protein FliL